MSRRKKNKSKDKVNFKRALANLKLRMASMSDNQVAEVVKVTGDGFLWSPEWRALREKVINRYGGRCMKCGYIPDRGVNVDHIKPRRFFPELALDESNLQVLCGRCNKAKGNKHMTDWRSRVHHRDEIEEEHRQHLLSILRER